MSPWARAALERIHGHVGWLAVAALIHPVVLLWRRRGRSGILASSLATGIVTVSAALGIATYPEYRARLKQQIFVSAPSVGWAFERKEHLAAGAVVLAWAGLCTHLGSRRSAGGATAEHLHQVARVAYASAALLALASAVLGLIVASYRSF